MIIVVDQMGRIQKGLEQPHGEYSNQFPSANDQIMSNNYMNNIPWYQTHDPSPAYPQTHLHP